MKLILNLKWAKSYWESGCNDKPGSSSNKIELEWPTFVSTKKTKKKLKFWKDRIGHFDNKIITAGQESARNDALLRFYYPMVDLDNLSYNEHARLIAEMDYCLHYNGSRTLEK